MRPGSAAVCHDLAVRDVLVVVFWLWLLVALGVYGYRIYRRITQGPKAEREARARAAATGEPSAVPPPRRAFGRTEPPPLPDGPVEPRLPRSLQGVAPEGVPEVPATAPDGGAPAAPTPLEPTAPAPAAPSAAPTLAEALSGIQMPDGLLPVIEASLPDVAEGRLARFSATGATVAQVAEAMAAELRRLGYAVDGLDTVTPARAGLSARRDDLAVAATVELDDATGAVLLELRA